MSPDHELTEAQVKASIRNWADKSATNPAFALHIAARLQLIARGSGTLSDLADDLVQQPEDLALMTPSRTASEQQWRQYTDTTYLTAELTTPWETPCGPEWPTGPHCFVPPDEPDGDPPETPAEDLG